MSGKGGCMSSQSKNMAQHSKQKKTNALTENFSNRLCGGKQCLRPACTFWLMSDHSRCAGQKHNKDISDVSKVMNKNNKVEEQFLKTSASFLPLCSLTLFLWSISPFLLSSISSFPLSLGAEPYSLGLLTYGEEGGGTLEVLLQGASPNSSRHGHFYTVHVQRITIVLHKAAEICIFLIYYWVK